MTRATAILAIDVGTQSVRALVFDPRRRRSSASARIPIEPYVSPQPGWAEQDPELYWRRSARPAGACWPTRRVRRDAIAGVALTTQRGTVVVTDAAGPPAAAGDRLARPAPDRGPAAAIGGDRPGSAFRALGVCATRSRRSRPTARPNWLRANEPDTWRAIRHYLLPVGLPDPPADRPVRRLARRRRSATSRSTTSAFRWAAPGDWRWTVAPDRARLAAGARRRRPSGSAS